MRSTFAASAALLSTLQLVAGQTFTDCDPTKKTCPSEPALGGTLITDFTKGAAPEWEPFAGTTLSYDSTNGAEFTIAKIGSAPTVGMHKYIMFGKVSVVMKASPGAGIVSSFVLESGDLDEIDWEWVGNDRAQVQTNFFGKGNTTTYDRGGFSPMDPKEDPMSVFHKYTIDWTADTLKWLIDDVLVRTVSYGDALALGGKNYPQTPMQVKMGSWIGCPSQAAADDPKTKWTCQWAGGPVDLSSKRTMYVQSVTVEDYGCAESYSYGDMSGSWQSIVSTGSCAGGKKSSPSSSSGASKSITAKPSSSSSPSSFGGILIETSKDSEDASATESSTLTKSATTLSTSTATNTALGASNSPGAPAQKNTVSTSQAETMAPKKKYGIMDAVVVTLGLGVGWLIM